MSESRRKPEIIVFAGPNGSGKSTITAYRIFKKRKDEYMYCPQPGLWLKEDIFALTGVDKAVKTALNKRTMLRE